MQIRFKRTLPTRQGTEDHIAKRAEEFAKLSFAGVS